MLSRSRKYSEPQVQKAIEQFQCGSAEAFRILYSRYQHRVYRFCVKMMSSEVLGKDAFQETFMRMYEHRKDFRGTNFPAWLFTIARNVCLNLLRKQRSFDSFEEDIHGGVLSTSKMSDSDVILKNNIDSAIQNLPVKLREALILREYEEYSYKEIAEITGIEVSLAKVRVHRARLILRKILSPIVQERYET